MSSEHLKLVSTPGSGKHEALIGKVLDDRYEIERLLGEGGMGLVFKARHVALGKPLAIKVLKSDVSKDQEIVQRFRQEAQSATAIGNHHIVDISDFGVIPDGSTYFVMEYLDGISLTNAIDPGKPLKASRTVHIAKQLCRALGAAHDAGIVHRDLKPDNIYLISRGGDPDFVKVLDFGIAKVGGAKSKLTQVGQVFGTPHYMSPEQCAGTAVDKRTDIYALGVIMYEMASSRVPFDADNMMGILTKHLYEEPVKPHALAPPVDVPPALESIIMKCLAKKPEHRYQTMQEVLADLELAEQGLTPSAVVESVRRASSAGARPRQPSEPLATSEGGLAVDVGSFELPRSSYTGLLIVFLLAVGASIGAYFAFAGGERSAEPAPRQTGPAAPAPIAQGEQAEARAQPTLPAPEPAKPEPAQREQAEPQVAHAQEPAPPPLPRPAPASVRVTIASNPQGAEIYGGGALLGRTPHELQRPAPGRPPLHLMLKLVGYRDAPLRVTSRTEGTLVVDLVRKTAVAPRPDPRPDEIAPAPPSPPVEQRPRQKDRPSTEVLDPWS